MAKIQTYDDMKIETLWSSPSPGMQIRKALTNTMADLTKMSGESNLSTGLLKYLITAEHTSVLEHAVISFMITGVSRSFLAQITRHRICSFTSSSQHYQEYGSYPCIVHPDYIDNEYMDDCLTDSVFGYNRMLLDSIPKEEARQFLPNACAVNLMWTINARSLWNFMRLRMCYRNVKEMRIFCNKLVPLIKQWWPEFATCCSPPCVFDGKCNQGYMSCGNPWVKGEI
jgi:thymidylate synthase (FAD)